MRYHAQDCTQRESQTRQHVADQQDHESLSGFLIFFEHSAEPFCRDEEKLEPSKQNNTTQVLPKNRPTSI